MTSSQITDAIWAGDTELLDELAPCRCCCSEHTFFDCPAREWCGCRGQYTTVMFYEDYMVWFRFYERTRGFTYTDFFGDCGE